MRGSIIKRGKKWAIVVDIGKDSEGKRKQKWYHGFKTKKEAEKELTIILHQIEMQTFVNPEKVTVAEYLKKWFEDYVKVNLAPTTIDGYRYMIEGHIIPSIGNIQLQQLQPLQVQQFYKEQFEHGRMDGKGGLAPKSVMYIHRVLREAIEHAYRMQIVNRNVVDFVDPPKLKKYRASVYDEIQVQRMLEAAKDTNIYIPVLLAVGLGLRRGEALGLRWEDIDFKNKTISINQSLLVSKQGLVFHSPKTEDSNRVIVVSDTIMQALETHKATQEEKKEFIEEAYQNNDLVTCYDDGTPIHPGNFSHMFAKLLKRNNLPHIRYHDLRHTNATLMLKYKVPAKVASERLGHSTIGITLDLYSHVLKEMQEDAACKIEDAIFKK